MLACYLVAVSLFTAGIIVNRAWFSAHEQDRRLAAPLFVSWQLTRDCDLACLHCCTDSAPGKRLPDELTAAEALELAEKFIASEVPYVMLCGGEPLVVPHFFADRGDAWHGGRSAQDRDQWPALRC